MILNNAQDAIKQAIGRLISFPKRATIKVWYGIKENVLRRLEVAWLVGDLTAVFSKRKSSASTYAINTITTLRSMDISLATKKLENSLKHHSLNGLANELGITKEGAQRLIWLFADARDTNNGSEKYSEKTILLVKNALFAERILKQTTIQFASPLLWMKNELPPTKWQWRVNDYGIKKMAEPFVGNATAT